jgi:hypothetical protein
VWWNEICQLNLGRYVIRSSYLVSEVYKNIITGIPNPSLPICLKAWHKSILSKVSCLVWRLFQNRVATKDNLIKRGVLDQSSSQCGRGCGFNELVSHLFFKCPIFTGVWYSTSKWLGISTAFYKDGVQMLDQYGWLIGSGRAFYYRIKAVWFACIWSIWKYKEVSIEKMTEDVKVHSWNWLRFKSKNLDYNIAEWCINPRACLRYI